MKIVVLVKQTPDTETKVKVSADGSKLELDGAKWIVNPYDDFAIEEAIKIKEKLGQGEVVAVTLGPDSAKEGIVKALAMGADRGVLVSHEGIDPADSLSIAKVLAAVVKAEAPQMVLCGRQGIDDDNMHVPTMVAELLKWPHLNIVTKIQLNGQTAVVDREVEGGQVEAYEVGLPCVFGAHKSLNTPRFVALQGIMKAKKKPLDVKKPQDYGLQTSSLQSKVKSLGFTLPPEKPAGKIFKDQDVGSMVDQVVKLLRDEAKVI